MSTLTKKQLEDILSVSVSGLNSKLEVMEKKLDALENLPTRLTKMEALLEKVNKENSDLIKAMAFKEEQINGLQRQLNALEQHNRSWSIRVNGLNIPAEVENSNKAVKKIVYDSLLLPIFKGAVEKGDLPAIPPLENTLEIAHILPAKGDAKKPVIARFFEREIRDVVFRNKKEFAPRGMPSRAGQPGRYVFPFFEDLTKINFAKMRAIAAHEKVSACWSSRGSLKYKLNGSDSIRSVHNVFDSIENILNS
jgi:hypothetical protein